MIVLAYFLISISVSSIVLHCLLMFFFYFRAHCTCFLHFVLIIFVTLGGQHWCAFAFSGCLLCLKIEISC